VTILIVISCDALWVNRSSFAANNKLSLQEYFGI
jgi:hypothetical protein